MTHHLLSISDLQKLLYDFRKFQMRLYGAYLSFESLKGPVFIHFHFQWIFFKNIIWVWYDMVVYMSKL